MCVDTDCVTQNNLIVLPETVSIKKLNRLNSAQKPSIQKKDGDEH